LSSNIIFYAIKEIRRIAMQHSFEKRETLDTS